MIRAEPQPTAQGEDLLTYRTVDFPRVAVGMLLRERNAHLHRATGMYRVQRAKQLLPHRDHTDEIIKDGAELFFGFHRVQPFAVAFAVRRGDFKRGMHEENRDMHGLRAAVDLFPGNFVQARHHRV